jgi:hypothetical protein
MSVMSVKTVAKDVYHICDKPFLTCPLYTSTLAFKSCLTKSHITIRLISCVYLTVVSLTCTVDKVESIVSSLVIPNASKSADVLVEDCSKRFQTIFCNVN